MSAIVVILAIIAAAVLGVIVDYLLKYILPERPKLPHLFGAVVAIAVLVLLAALPEVMGLPNITLSVTISPTSTITSTPTITKTPYIPLVSTTPPTHGSDDWLVRINEYRLLANLPAVRENSEWSAEAFSQGRYMAINDDIQNNKDSEAFLKMATSNKDITDQEVIDTWIQAPFHALYILDPALRQVGFGIFRDDSGFRAAAALKVLFLGAVPQNIDYPIVWPWRGGVLSITEHWGDYPNPVDSCEGYSSPTGIPVILQLGPGFLVPKVENFSFTKDGIDLESCVFTEETYTSPDSEMQNLGRAILRERDAVVLIPRYPLVGGTYTPSVRIDGQTYSWSFQVSESSTHAPDPSSTPLPYPYP